MEKNGEQFDKNEFEEACEELKSLLDEEFEKGKSPNVVVGSLWATLLGLERAARKDEESKESNKMFG